MSASLHISLHDFPLDPKIVHLTPVLLPVFHFDYQFCLACFLTSGNKGFHDPHFKNLKENLMSHFVVSVLTNIPITVAITKEGNDVLTAGCLAAVTSLDISTSHCLSYCGLESAEITGLTYVECIQTCQA